MVLECGIDEAGRGPVIGPLVIAGVVIDERKLPQLKEMGVADSKLVSPVKREALYQKIIDICKGHFIIVVEPSEIDKHPNLNWLEAEKQAEIINVLKPERAIIDCPSTNTRAFKDYLKKLLTDPTIMLKVEHKADLHYVSCSAGSILAKVTRDRLIEELKQKIGKDFGSGYPSDPTTAAFVQKYWNVHGNIMRHSWETYKREAGKLSQKTLGGF